MILLTKAQNKAHLELAKQEGSIYANSDSLCYMQESIIPAKWMLPQKTGERLTADVIP